MSMLLQWLVLSAYLMWCYEQYLLIGLWANWYKETPTKAQGNSINKKHFRLVWKEGVKLPNHSRMHHLNPCLIKQIPSHLIWTKLLALMFDVLEEKHGNNLKTCIPSRWLQGNFEKEKLELWNICSNQSPSMMGNDFATPNNFHSPPLRQPNPSWQPLV